MPIEINWLANDLQRALGNGAQSMDARRLMSLCSLCSLLCNPDGTGSRERENAAETVGLTGRQDACSRMRHLEWVAVGIAGTSETRNLRPNRPLVPFAAPSWIAEENRPPQTHGCFAHTEREDPLRWCFVYYARPGCDGYSGDGSSPRQHSQSKFDHALRVAYIHRDLWMVMPKHNASPDVELETPQIRRERKRFRSASRQGQHEIGALSEPIRD